MPFSSPGGSGDNDGMCLVPIVRPHVNIVFAAIQRREERILRNAHREPSKDARANRVQDTP